jgi:hypothetical protein
MALPLRNKMEYLKKSFSVSMSLDENKIVYCDNCKYKGIKCSECKAQELYKNKEND